MSTEQKEQILILLKTRKQIPQFKLEVIEQLIDDIAESRSDDELDIEIMAAWVIYCWNEVAS